MTTPADDTAAETAFEALLAGRPVSRSAAGLAAFTDAVRVTATTPGRPNAALAELLATGLLADHPSPSTRTAPSAGRSPRRSRIRRRRRFAMFFPALLAKFLSAGAVAQAASGVGIAVVAFTGAGATGLLGDDVQTTLTSVVGTETTTGTTTDGATTVPAATPATETPTTDVAGSTDGADPSDAAGFTLDPDKSVGEQIHGQVDHGSFNGTKVSELVHGRNEERKAGTTATATAEAGDDSSGDDESESTESSSTESTSGGHGNSGRGHN